LKWFTPRLQAGSDRSHALCKPKEKFGNTVHLFCTFAAICEYDQISPAIFALRLFIGRETDLSGGRDLAVANSKKPLEGGFC
jgi:hypothetical protein